jgi:hypothetical protein
MKKIALLIIILSTLWIQINTSFAVDDSSPESSYVNIRVSEKIPWANCWTGTEIDNTIYYDCKIPKWTAAIVSMLWKILERFTYIAALVWVWFIVYNWILYSMWGINESMKTEAKERIVYTLIGLAILFLAWPFLQIIAPWVYK